MHLRQERRAKCTLWCLLTGTALPKEGGAVGWRIGVYWADDMTFYPAEVTAFDASSGCHRILYDDGVRACQCLRAQSRFMPFRA